MVRIECDFCKIGPVRFISHRITLLFQNVSFPQRQGQRCDQLPQVQRPQGFYARIQTLLHWYETVERTAMSLSNGTGSAGRSHGPKAGPSDVEAIPRDCQEAVVGQQWGRGIYR